MGLPMLLATLIRLLALQEFPQVGGSGTEAQPAAGKSPAPATNITPARDANHPWIRAPCGD